MFHQYYFYLFLQFTVFLDVLSHASPLLGKKVKLAKKGEFPFIVSISDACGNSDEDNHICGGALISKRHVLTSAHCIEDCPRITCLSIIVNSINLVTGKKYNASTATTYDDWANQNDITLNYTDNDIAIIRLSQKVEGVIPGVISKLKMNEVIGKRVVTAGWGYIDTSKFLRPKSLQKAYMTVLTDEERQSNEMKLFGEVIDMHPNLYYTSAKPSVITTCGDSGGPLLLASDRTIVGINDSTCDIANAEENPNAMSLHLAVDSFRDSIESLIKD